MVDLILLDALGAADPSSFLDVSRIYQRSLSTDVGQTFLSRRTIYDSTVFIPTGSASDGTAYLGHVAIAPNGALGFAPVAVMTGTVGGANIGSFLSAQVASGQSGDRLLSNLLSGDDYIRGNDGRDPQGGVHELHGYAGDDVIQSGTLATSMYGDNGDDVLFLANTYAAYGGDGRDLLILDRAQSRDAGIQGFVVRQDTIGLLDDVFPELDGAVTRANTRFGAAAKDADDRLIVDFQNDAKTFAILYFDVDGTGPREQRQIGRVGSDAPVTVRDFAVVHANDFIPGAYQAPHLPLTHDVVPPGERFAGSALPAVDGDFTVQLL